VVFEGAPARTRVLDRAALGPGHAFDGPAVVQEYTATTLVPPGVHARVTPGGHLALTR
jgi:N-methylhydantoinase A